MFKGHSFPKSIILQGVYFKLRFSLSYREVGGLLQIRGVLVDHATIQRWVFKFAPLVGSRFRKRKKAVSPAGEWTKLTLKQKEFGSIYIGPWTSKGIQLIFF